MGKQNKNIFDCQGGDFSLKSLDDSFDAEDGEWYPDNSDETDVVLAASLDFYVEEALQKRTEGTRYIQNENAVFLFLWLV